MAELYHQKSISANDYEKAVAGLQQLEVELQSNKRQLSFTRLYAPVDGYVQSVNFTASEMVNAGMAVVSLLDMAEMEVACNIPFDIKTDGAKFYCHVADIGETFPMQQLSIAPKTDNNQLRELRLAFKRMIDKRIVAGMNAEVVISAANPEAKHQSATFTIPLTSIFEDSDGKACVWIVKADSTIIKRAITVSPDVLNGKAIITNGLNAHERIVSSGASTLQEGEKVSPLSEPKASNVGGLL